MPVWARYLITSIFVLICFEVRRRLEGIYPYPYLVFLPGIVLASFVFNRGSGFFATFFSGGLAGYFFIEPRGTFTIADGGSAASLVLFVLVGALIASVIEALRVTAEELANANRELLERRSALRDSVNRLETIIESAPDPIYLKDPEGRYVLVNAAAVVMFGLPRAAIVGRRDRDFLPADAAAAVERDDLTVMETRSAVASEEKRSAPGRGGRWHLVTKTPWYDADGNMAGVLGIARDIHELKQTSEELRASDEQKGLMLKDISHRIKNHLQSLIAVISASRRQKPDGDVGEVLQSMIGRIVVLARAYDRFEIKDGQQAVVNIADYLRALVDDISAAVLGSRPVSVTVDVPPLEMDTSRAVTIGLIVNEAMTNALKHAFPGDRAGSIAVRVFEQERTLVLRVSDDGVGGPHPETVGSTGHWLMRAMARQLRGRLQWEGPPGTAVVVRFPR